MHAMRLSVHPDAGAARRGYIDARRDEPGGGQDEIPFYFEGVMKKILICGMLALAQLVALTAQASTPKSALLAVSVTVVATCSVSMDQANVTVACSHHDVGYSVSQASAAGDAANPAISRAIDGQVVLNVVTY